MNPLTIIALIFAFWLMWEALYWLLTRAWPMKSALKLPEVLEQEQAEHDRFWRTVRRLGRDEE